jgi:hypothetical protein
MKSLRASLGISSNGHKWAADYLVAYPATEGDYTRAQKWAIVIVQDAPDKTSRLATSPFSKPLKSSS